MHHAAAYAAYVVHEQGVPREGRAWIKQAGLSHRPEVDRVDWDVKGQALVTWCPDTSLCVCLLSHSLTLDVSVCARGACRVSSRVCVMLST